MLSWTLLEKVVVNTLFGNFVTFGEFGHFISLFVNFVQLLNVSSYELMSKEYWVQYIVLFFYLEDIYVNSQILKPASAVAKVKF